MRVKMVKYRQFGLINGFYYIPSSEILEFPSEKKIDIITSDDINFHFTSCRNLGTTFFFHFDFQTNF